MMKYFKESLIAECTCNVLTNLLVDFAYLSNLLESRVFKGTLCNILI